MDDLFISINNYVENLSFNQNEFEDTQSRLYKINEPLKLSSEAFPALSAVNSITLVAPLALSLIHI